jgi:hypothetical protein
MHQRSAARRIHEQLIDVPLLDIVEAAIDAMPYDERQDYRAPLAILHCALDTIGRRLPQ